jgi:hypothetical protein
MEDLQQLKRKAIEAVEITIGQINRVKHDIYTLEEKWEQLNDMTLFAPESDEDEPEMSGTGIASQEGSETKIRSPDRSGEGGDQFRGSEN